MASHRRGPERTFAAVEHEDRHDDLRVLDGGVADIPGVGWQDAPLGEVLEPAPATLDGDVVAILRGACLARRGDALALELAPVDVRRAGEELGFTKALVDHPHAFGDDLEVTPVYGQRIDDFRLEDRVAVRIEGHVDAGIIQRIPVGVGDDRLAVGSRSCPGDDLTSVVDDDHVAVSIRHMVDDARPVEKPAVGNDRGHLGDLERGGGHEALTDAQVVVVTGGPGFTLCLALPGAGRQVPFGLQGEFDPLDAAEAELLAVEVDAVDRQAFDEFTVLVKAAGDLVEVDVARVGDAQAHVHGPVPFQVPADKRLDAAGIVRCEPVRDLDRAGVVQVALGRDDAFLQCRRRRNELEGRAGRVGAADRVVDQRRVFVPRQTQVVVNRHFGLKAVVIEGGEVDHRQDLARLRVHGDDRGLLDLREAALAGDAVHAHRVAVGLHELGQHIGRDRLQARVQGQVHVKAGLRFRSGSDLADFTSRPVLFDLAPALLAGQFDLHRRLKPGPADAVIALVAKLVDPALIGNRAHVADDVGGQGAAGILAQRLGDDAHARQEDAFLLDAIGDIDRHAGGDDGRDIRGEAVFLDDGLDAVGQLWHDAGLVERLLDRCPVDLGQAGIGRHEFRVGRGNQRVLLDGVGDGHAGQ